MTEERDDLAHSVHLCEPDAFERLVARYETSLFNYAHRILDDRFDAQEVVQDAFLRAHEALTKQYDTARVRELALKPWLFRITRNLCLNKRRGLKAKLSEPLPDFDDNRMGPLVPASSVSGAAEAREERAALERALSMLPPESRELVVLRFMEEMSYADIAATVGVEESVLRGRVFRSLKLLREALTRNEVTHAM